jgi:hypothetical protein
VLEKWVVRRIFGPKREKVRGKWRKLHEEERDDLYCLRNVVRVIRLGNARWAEHVARMGKKRNTYRSCFQGNLKERDHLGELDADGKIKFQWIENK